MSTSLAASHGPARRRELYRLVWRWHFYAGLFCIPFVLWLSLTGSIYLFRPQIDAWLERPYHHVDAAAPRRPPSAQVTAALAAVPGGVLNAYQLPDGPHAPAQVLVGRGAGLYRVYVDPVSARVLHSVAEDSRFTRMLFYLHGELMLGSYGSMAVELAASWAIVMILSGLYLWWPRGSRLAGVLYPRLGKRGRLFWRDLHAVVGFWVSLFALFLLVSGLPWAKSWGGMLKDAREWAASAPPSQDWTTGRADELARRKAANTPAFDEHANMPGMHHGGAMAMPVEVDYAPLDRLAPTVSAMRLAAPVLIAPPSAAAAGWTARSDAANRPLRTNLVLDGADGRVLKRIDFDQRPWLDRAIGYGVAAHEGQLFGALNQALGVCTALGLVTLSISALIMWWRRRPPGVLGAPPAHAARYPGIAVGALVLLGIVLPLLGASMLLVLAVERGVLARLPPARRFLGLA